MVIDTSAMIAIQFAEPESSALTVAILASETRLMSAATYVEYVAVLARRFPRFAAADWAERVVAGLGIKVVDVTAAHALLAADALETYGRARHQAGRQPRARAAKRPKACQSSWEQQRKSPCQSSPAKGALLLRTSAQK